MSRGKDLNGNMWGELYNWGHQEQAVLTLYRPRLRWLLPHLPIPVVHVILCFVSWDARIPIKKPKGKQKEAHQYANFCFEDRFFPMPFYYRLTWDLPSGLCWCCLSVQNGSTEAIHCLTFLRTDMSTVKTVPAAFMQSSALASFSVHGPLWQKQMVCRLGQLPNYLHVYRKQDRSHSAELCPTPRGALL